MFRDHDLIKVIGMGGSHLAAGVLKTLEPRLPIDVNHDYLITDLKPGPDRTLYIASSYSGNTEEVISGLHQLLEADKSVAVMTTGGELLELASFYHLPMIQLPADGIQPRSALGYATVGLALLLGRSDISQRLAALPNELDRQKTVEAGQSLAKRLHNKIPVIYTTTIKEALAYNWKIKFNETGKIPAFYNLYPELNHNEMTGFDRVEANAGLSDPFYFLHLTLFDDHPQNLKRVELTDRLYREKGLSSEIIQSKEVNKYRAVFESLLTADWAAYHIALANGSEPEQVPMVERFKRLLI